MGLLLLGGCRTELAEVGGDASTDAAAGPSCQPPVAQLAPCPVEGARCEQAGLTCSCLPPPRSRWLCCPTTLAAQGAACPVGVGAAAAVCTVDGATCTCTAADPRWQCAP